MHDSAGVLAVEGPLSDHVVERMPRGVDVAGRADLHFAVDHSGDVVGRAESFAGLGPRRPLSVMARARPMSASLATPPLVSMMFLGLTSRWTRPLAWAWPGCLGHLDDDVDRVVLG